MKNEIEEIIEARQLIREDEKYGLTGEKELRLMELIHKYSGTGKI